MAPPGASCGETTITPLKAKRCETKERSLDIVISVQWAGHLVAPPLFLKGTEVRASAFSPAELWGTALFL